MRLRNVPGARETIIENQFSIQAARTEERKMGMRYLEMIIRSTSK